MGRTVMYYPFTLWIERSQMTPYHKKLLIELCPSILKCYSAVED